MTLPFMKESLDGLIRTEPIVGLTKEGTSRISQYEGEGPGFDIMATLKESGPLPISELAEHCHMGANKVRHVVRDLMKRGYVEKKRGG